MTKRSGFFFWIASGAALLPLAASTAVAAPAPATQRPPLKAISCVALMLPKDTNNGSGYTACSAGPDGKVYIGTAMYGGSAHLVQYDPHKKVFNDLFNMHELTGEHGAGLDSQSKIHTKLVFDSSGRVFGGSKQGNEEFEHRPEYGEDPDGFPGGHLFSYDPRTGQAVDYGILKRQEGLMGGAIDNERHRVYYWSFPKTNLLRFDLDTHKTYDLGPTGVGARYMACTPSGTVWLPGRGLWERYRADSDHIEDIPISHTGSEEYQDPYSFVMSPDGKKIWGTTYYGDNYIWELEPTDGGATIAARPVCATAPAGWKVSDIHACVLGNDGAIYYPCVADSGDGVQRAHLMRAWPKTGQRDDLGIITPTDLATAGMKVLPIYFQGMTVTSDGTLYMTSIEPYDLLVFSKLTGRK